jgi:hypothetical protein
MSTKGKSVLDSIPIQNHAFPLRLHAPLPDSVESVTLLPDIAESQREVVGNCPSCGNPIYGKLICQGPPSLTRTCACAPLAPRQLGVVK